MKTSETIEKLAAALATAQGEMKNATLNKVNPHFKSKYADLAGIRDATVKVLSKHGLSVVQATSVTETGLVLHTRLLHSSGQWIAGDYPLPMNMEKPQAMGSALTYARRYSLSAICGIASDEDDDANAAASASSSRSHGPDEPVVGAINKSALQAQLRDFDTQLAAVSDEDELYGLLQSYDAVLQQCQRDLPTWWQTKQGSDALGISDRIEARKTELAPDPDNPSTYPA